MAAKRYSEIRSQRSHRLHDRDWRETAPGFTPDHRGKTVTKPLTLSGLGLSLSEKQIPQVVENLESGGKPKEALEAVALRPRQVRWPGPYHC